MRRPGGGGRRAMPEPSTRTPYEGEHPPKVAADAPTEGPPLPTTALPDLPPPLVAPAFQDAEETPPDVPGYEILGRLAAGGMGVVYRARQLSLSRLVALQVIRSEAAG